MSKVKARIVVAVVGAIGAILVALIQFRPFQQEAEATAPPKAEPIQILVEVRDSEEQSAVPDATVEVIVGATVTRHQSGTDGRTVFSLDEEFAGEIAEVSAVADGYGRVQESHSVPSRDDRYLILLQKTRPSSVEKADGLEELIIVQEEPRSQMIQEVVACSHLSVTAEWQGTGAPPRREACLYEPPEGWKIMTYRVDVHSDNNGDYAVRKVGGGLRVEVEATPHGSFFDRRRGWIDVTVYATIERVD